MASLWNSPDKLSSLKKQMQVGAIGCAAVTLCVAMLLTISNHRLATLRGEQVQNLQRQQAHIQKSTADNLQQVLNQMHQELSAVQAQLQAEKVAGESLRAKLAVTQKQLIEAKAEFQRQTVVPTAPAPNAIDPQAETSVQPALPEPVKAVAPTAETPLPAEPSLTESAGGSNRQASLEGPETPTPAPTTESSDNR